MDLSKVNRGFPNAHGTTQNCMYCTTAYDLRRRGYDVVANKRMSGGPLEDIYKWYKGAIVEKAFEGSTDQETIANLCRDMLSHGEGARGNVVGVYKGSMSGHSMIWEVVNNKVLIRDGQTNTTYENPADVLQYFNKAQMWYARLDNLDLNARAIKQAVRNA